MRIIVIGGAGFIGSSFIRMLSSNSENELVVLDKLTYAGNLANIFDTIASGVEFDQNDYKQGNVKFIRVDLAEPGSKLQEIFQSFKPEYIINFAAESHVDNSLVCSSIFLTSNVVGVGNLLHNCVVYQNASGQLKRIVQVSTDEVYGSLGLDDEPWDEETKLQPRNHYSASKAAAEMVANSYYETEQLPIVITRSSNNYGPYQYPEKLIPLFVTNLIIGKKVPVYGTGKNIRDWIHIDDNCKAIYSVMKDGRNGQIYNIAGETQINNIDITNMILEIMQSPKSMIDFVQDRKGHDLRYAINSSKIKNELKWSPKVDFSTGLIDTIDWYKSNQQWWKPLKSRRI